MKRDLAIVGVLWLALTVVGEAVVLNASLLPPLISNKGADIGHAFRVLLVYAVPVFAFVVAALIYMVPRYRAGAAETPPEDGPPLRGRGRVPLAWFGVTTALAVALMIYPGLTELPKVLGENRNPELVVDVQGVQWAWIVSYPQYKVKSMNELVLPVDQLVRFELTSLDVLHGFWIPAFGMTMEAVPGMTTTVQYRPTKTGSFAGNPLLRLQCSELCGLNHSTMSMPVRVVSAQEFQDWVRQQAGTTASPISTPSAGETRLTIAAKDTRFSTDRLEARAGAPVSVTFKNEDDSVFHDIAFYRTADAKDLIAKTDLKPGPVTEQLGLPVLPPGTYYFRCDVHPAEMKGELVIK